MIVKQLYKYTVEIEMYGEMVEAVTIATERPEGIDYVLDGVRIISEEGMVLVNDVYSASDLIRVLDVISTDGWSEVPEPPLEEQPGYPGSPEYPWYPWEPWSNKPSV